MPKKSVCAENVERRENKKEFESFYANKKKICNEKELEISR